MSPHSTIAPLLVTVALLFGGCGDDGVRSEPLGVCGLPISQCSDVGSAEDALGADSVAADVVGVDSVGADVATVDSVDADGAAVDSVAVDVAVEVDAAAQTDAQGTDASDPAPVPAWVVTPAWLAEHLDDAGVQVIDVRSASAYATSRVRGAVRVDVAALRATVDGVPSQVAPAASVAAVLGSAGVAPTGLAVVVGDDTSTVPARVVWTLAYYGHEARLLDGGFAPWLAAGYPIDAAAAPSAATTDYPLPSPLEALRVDGAWVLAHLDDPTVWLVDARAAGEYAAGHIPGAVSVDWTRNVAGGALRPHDDVAALYAEVPSDATVIAYCASGTRASMDWLALSWLGYADVRLYDGSWAEWSMLPGAPVETN